jgi:carbonic anhydrase
MPQKSLQRLTDGVRRFQREVYPQQAAFFRELEKGQRPHTLFITCADSRLNPHVLTQTQPGEIFVARTIGNLVPPHGSGDRGTAALMEYAVQVLQVEHVIICGHSSCGAVKSLMDPHDDETVPRVSDWLHYAETARAMTRALAEKAPPIERLKVATEQNVVAQLANIRTYPAVATAVALGKLDLHGWYYEIGSGGVETLDGVTNTFQPLVADA